MRTKAELEVAQKKILNQIRFAQDSRFPTIVVERFKDELAEVDAEMALLNLDEEKKEDPTFKDLSLPVLIDKLYEMLKIR